MTTDDDLCPWSDLPRHTCAHCLGQHDAATPPLPERPALRVVHPVAPQAPARRVRARHLDDVLVTLHDYVTALCDATVHREPFQTLHTNADGSHTWVTERHRTTSPPLLQQLWSAIQASGSAESGARSFASKPSARLDAIDAAADIEHGVHQWLARLGVADSHDAYPDLIVALRHLGSLAAAGGAPDLLRDVRGWWVRARVLTGWDSPAWRPDNTCPLCGVRGSLRVKLDARSATCVDCHEAWWPETIGLLADHIRMENHEDDVAAM